MITDMEKQWKIYVAAVQWLGWFRDQSTTIAFALKINFEEMILGTEAEAALASCYETDSTAQVRRADLSFESDACDGKMNIHVSVRH